MPFTDSIKTANVILMERDSLDTTPSDVLSNKKFIGTASVISTGEIPINEEKTDMTLSAGQNSNIPFGYNPSSYTITAQSLDEQTQGSAIEENILLNKVAWVNGERLVGSMPNNGPGGTVLSYGETYEIEEGYYNGNGVIEVVSLEEQTLATATEEDIFLGKTAWVNGVELTGTMPINENITETLDAGDSYIIPEGYHDGEGIVSAKSLSSQTAGTALSSDILLNKTAWVNGVELTGTIPDVADNTYYLPLNGTYIIPMGYHSGEGKVKQNIPTKNGETVSAQNVEQTLEVAGYYMQGNIKIRAVDAMNYQFSDAVMKNNNNESLLNYECIPDGSPAKCKIKLAADNLHDNSTTNVYKIKVEEQANDSTIFKFDMFIIISNAKPVSVTLNNNQLISIGFEQENQYIEIYPYKPNTDKILLTVIDVISLCQYI